MSLRERIECEQSLLEIHFNEFPVLNPSNKVPMLVAIRPPEFTICFTESLIWGGLMFEWGSMDRYSTCQPITQCQVFLDS